MVNQSQKNDKLLHGRRERVNAQPAVNLNWREPMPRKYKGKSVHENLVAHLKIGNECWIWAGCLDGQGYSIIHAGGSRYFAYRAIYEMVYGPIPKELEIDHLCHNRKCVRPDHLEAVTHAENMRRSAVYKQWTQCAKGHPLRGENLAPSNGGRFRCRTCKQERSRLDSAKNIAMGLCKCGKNLEGKYKSCVKCRERALASWRRKNPLNAGTFLILPDHFEAG